MKLPTEDLDLLLDLDADQELSPREHRRVEEALRSHPRLEAERRRLLRLHELLDGARRPVNPGLHRQIMRSLPPAAWETHHVRAWRVPLLVVFVLGALAALLAETGAGTANAQGALPAAFGAIADLVGAALLTGAGLLSASWRALGLGLRDVLSASPGTLAAFGAGLGGLLVLLVSLLRSGPRTAEQKVTSRER